MSVTPHIPFPKLPDGYRLYLVWRLYTRDGQLFFTFRSGWVYFIVTPGRKATRDNVAVQQSLNRRKLFTLTEHTGIHRSQ